MVATRSSPLPNLPRKRGKELVGQNKLSYAPILLLARASPFPRLRGKVRKGAASSGTLSESCFKKDTFIPIKFMNKCHPTLLPLSDS